MSFVPFLSLIANEKARILDTSEELQITEKETEFTLLVSNGSVPGSVTRPHDLAFDPARMLGPDSILPAARSCSEWPVSHAAPAG